MNYTQERLWKAVSALIGSGTSQDRLSGAGRALSTLVVGAEPAFPAMPQAQALLESVHQRLTVKSGGEFGAIHATTRELSDDECEVIAGDILELYTEASRAARIPVGARETVIFPNERN